MIDPNNQLGEIIEKGQNTTAAQVSDIAQRLKGQVLGSDKKTPQVQPETLPQDIGSSDRTTEMVKDLYSPSTSTTPVASVQADTQKLASVRQQLQAMHRQTYSDPLFDYEKRKPEPTKAEEQEQEEKNKLQELAQKQEKKDNDIALQRAKTSIEARVSSE